MTDQTPEIDPMASFKELDALERHGPIPGRITWCRSARALAAEVTRLTQELAETHRCWDETNEILGKAEADLLVCRQENSRLLRGEFTAEEIHSVCHNLHGTVSARQFANGCAAEQRKLYGCAPDADVHDQALLWCARTIDLEQGIDRVVEALRTSAVHGQSPDRIIAEHARWADTLARLLAPQNEKADEKNKNLARVDATGEGGDSPTASKA